MNRRERGERRDKRENGKILIFPGAETRTAEPHFDTFFSAFSAISAVNIPGYKIGYFVTAIFFVSLAAMETGQESVCVFPPTVRCSD
jgi:hypothetical protein